MEDIDLERLYDEVIVQGTYPGGICPTERNLVRYVKGALSDRERQSMDEHFLSCQPCAEMANALESAHRWFLENEQSVALEIAERAAQMDVYAGEECPAVQVLEKYCVAAVPNTDAGRRFRQRTSEHLAACSACRRTVDAWGRGLERVVTMTLDEFRGGMVGAALDRVRELMLTIREAVAVQSVGQPAFAKAGYRTGRGASLSAIVLDQQGRIVLDDDGRPVQVAFDVIRAHIEEDGHFVLDLSASDQRYWESASGRFVVSATLLGENTRLVLPRECIRSDGRVTIVGRIPSGVEIKEVPVSAMSLAVLEETEKTYVAPTPSS